MSMKGMCNIVECEKQKNTRIGRALIAVIVIAYCLLSWSYVLVLPLCEMDQLFKQ